MSLLSELREGVQGCTGDFGSEDEPKDSPPSLAEQLGIQPCVRDDSAAACPDCGWPWWWDDAYGGRHCCRCLTPPGRTFVRRVLAAVGELHYAGPESERVPSTPGWQDVTAWVIGRESGGRWRLVFPGLGGC